MNERKSLTDKYVDFMGSWMAGSVVGHYLGKLIVFILFIWLAWKYACN